MFHLSFGSEGRRDGWVLGKWVPKEMCTWGVALNSCKLVVSWCLSIEWWDLLTASAPGGGVLH